MFYVTDTLEIRRMKKIFVIIGFFLSFLAFAQQGDTDAVVKAFKSANTEEIAQYFDDYIDLKLLDKEEVKNKLNEATKKILECYDSTLKELYKRIPEVISLCLDAEKELFGGHISQNEFVGVQNFEFAK